MREVSCPIVPVVTKENHREWIEKAKTLPQKDLEREVTAVNPNTHPIREKIRPVAKEVSELKVSIDFKTEENLTALKELVSQKLGKPASLSEVVRWAAEVTRDRFDPLRKAERLETRSKKISLRKSEGSSDHARHRDEGAMKRGRRCLRGNEIR